MDILTYGLLNKKVEEAKNISGEKITEAVNTYLDENPPVTGATSEQAEQIQDNTNKISELKSDLDALSSVAIASEFIRGAWNSIEDRFVELNTRILSSRTLTATDDFVVSIKTGYEYIIYIFTESGCSASGFLTTPMLINKGQKYRIGVRKNPEETTEVNIEEFASKLLLFSQPISKEDEYLYKNSYDIPTNDWLRKNGESLKNGSVWNDGSFHSDQSFRVSTENLLTAICDFSINAKPGFLFIAHIYNGSGYSNYGVIKKLKVSKGEQFKLVILRTIENTSEIADIDEFAKGISINSVELLALAEHSNSRLLGKKINIIGDSYVANHLQDVSLTWHSKLASKYHMEYRNYGINGNGLVANATGTPVVSRYSEMENDADYIIVIGGKNDYNKQISLDDFKNGLSLLCKGLVNKYVGKQICFFTPWRVPQDVLEELGNGGTIPLTDYCDAIVEVCNKYSIPVFDTKDSGIYTFDSTFRTNYFQGANDISHLNGNGHDLMLRKAESYIESL